MKRYRESLTLALFGVALIGMAAYVACNKGGGSVAPPAPTVAPAPPTVAEVVPQPPITAPIPVVTVNPPVQPPTNKPSPTPCPLPANQKPCKATGDVGPKGMIYKGYCGETPTCKAIPGSPGFFEGSNCTTKCPLVIGN